MTEDVISLQPEEEVLEHAEEEGQKYRYPEFSGWSGERYLKKLLRQILPWSLYRTWEIFTDHQAPGSACYLGLSRLAEMAGRNTRTMEKNLASLCAKQLLVERAERQLFRSADGQNVISRVVVIKDFGGLYALAHDYHQWLADPDYIAPDRELMALVVQEPQLVARVRRFENYRRLLSHRPPGPVAKQRKEDRWFPPYQPDLPSAPFHAACAEGANVMKNALIPSILSANHLALDSPKQRNEERKRETGERDSLDSIDPSPVSVLEERTSALIVVCDNAEGHAEAENITHASSAPGPMHKMPMLPVSETALAVSELTTSFLRIIVGPFGDQNPKGSQTRLCTLVSEAPRPEPAEVLHCLVQAYLVARNTRTIQAKHCSPTGGANRMPLFFAMVQRFLQEAAPAEEESWLAVKDALVSDSCLAQWWNKHHRQIALPSHTLASDDGARETLQEAEDQEDQAPETAETARPAPRPSRLSQSNAERETRAALAYRVLWRLIRMGVMLQNGTVLWEHLHCGCPLYHRPQGRETCALCFPDPAWPEEALMLLRSIVTPEQEQEQEDTGTHTVVEVDTSSKQARDCWTDRDKAHQEALHLLDTLTRLGYEVEVFLERAGTEYQVVVRDDRSEWICTCPEHIDALMAQASQSIPEAHGQEERPVCSTV